MMDNTDEEMGMPLSGSSIGDGVSGEGQSVTNEDDGLYYIPERRPSLDLGPSPMDTSNWHYVEQALPPVLSYSSMTSDDNTDRMEDNGFSTRIQLERADSYSSCYSFDSDDCEKKTLKIKPTEEVSVPCDTPPLIQDTNEFVHPSLTVAFTFKTICDILTKLSAANRNEFKRSLWKHLPQLFITPPQNMDTVDLADRLLECYKLEESLQITKALLLELGQRSMAEHLQKLCHKNEIRHDLCEILRKKYGEVCEDPSMEGEKRPFDDVYSDVCMTGHSNYGPNIEHEVMTIEKLHTNVAKEKLLSTKDIFSDERIKNSNTNLVLLSGVAGSGKSMVVRKIILDWTEGRSHQHVTFLFPFTFRELKQFENRQISFLDIIHELYPPAKPLTLDDLRSEECRVMFIFDGLHEYNDKLDFFNTELYGVYPEPTSLNVIVVNLLRARLLFDSLFLVTCRSQAKHSVPWDTQYDEIQVHGFRDPGKDEYFKKRFKDPDQADRVIAHVYSLKTFHIMCHLPLFCSLLGDECQRMFREQGTEAELPRSLTYMYTKLLLALMHQHRPSGVPHHSPDDERDLLMKVGELAFKMLDQGRFTISKLDWDPYGISEEVVVDHCGICTQFLIKPHVLYSERVFSFIHPTMQEYMAALYAFLSYINQGKSVFELQFKKKFKGMFKGHKLMELYKSAVERSLQYKDGKLDIFLRFLFGMATNPSLELLTPFCTSSIKWPTVIDDTAPLIRKKIQENQHPNRKSNLQCCLNELGL